MCYCTPALPGSHAKLLSLNIGNALAYDTFAGNGPNVVLTLGNGSAEKLCTQEGPMNAQYRYLVLYRKRGLGLSGSASQLSIMQVLALLTVPDNFMCFRDPAATQNGGVLGAPVQQWGLWEICSEDSSMHAHVLAFRGTIMSKIHDWLGRNMQFEPRPLIAGVILAAL